MFGKAIRGRRGFGVFELAKLKTKVVEEKEEAASLEKESLAFDAVLRKVYCL